MTPHKEKKILPAVAAVRRGDPLRVVVADAGAVASPQHFAARKVPRPRRAVVEEVTRAFVFERHALRRGALGLADGALLFFLFVGRCRARDDDGETAEQRTESKEGHHSVMCKAK